MVTELVFVASNSNQNAADTHTNTTGRWPHTKYRLTSCVEHSKHLLSPVGTGVWTYLQTGQLVITHKQTQSMYDQRPLLTSTRRNNFEVRTVTVYFISQLDRK